MIRRLLSTIAVRLLLFNVLLVFLPVAGLLSLASLERQLLDLHERSMVQQGRLVAAALGGDAPLTAETARGLLQRMGGRSESRIRIVDARGILLADSARLSSAPVAEANAYEPATAPVPRKRLLYRIGTMLWHPLNAARDWFDRVVSPRSLRSTDATPATVVQRALQGRYGATVRESAGQRSLTLYSAVPVRAGGEGQVMAAVVVSQSTSRILRALWRVRLDVFEVFVGSLVVAAILSLLMSATIARPLIQLRNEAGDLLDHRGRLRKTFRGSMRRDEIGDLTRALRELTERLERHLQFVESVSADVSHEFKNPLTSIRNAAELLVESGEERERAELVATIDKEVARLNRLLNAMREVSRIDAAVEMEATARIDLRALLSTLAQTLSSRSRGVRIELVASSRPLVVAASEDRLMQAFGNILDNAVSFSPDGARVAISLTADDGAAVVFVDDDGEGIPEEHLERIFDRFFSFRRDARDEARDHDGLGLAIARAIVEGYGGRIRAANRAPRGARIEVRLPAA